MITIGRPMLLMALIAIITACNQQAPPTVTPAATPLPAIELNPISGAVKASGEVVPARKADLGFPGAGRVDAVAVDVGDEVEADALLVALADASAQAAVLQAQAALIRAEANLAELQSGPRTQEIATAQARLEATQAELAQLAEGARPDEITAARSALAAARAARQELYDGPREEDRIATQAELSNAESVLQLAQSEYDKVS